MLSSVLGNGSDSGEDVWADLTGHHFCWICLLLGPKADEPVTVNSMLDCGVHVILIEEAMVNTLGLCHFHLHKPVTISLALDNDAPS